MMSCGVETCRSGHFGGSTAYAAPQNEPIHASTLTGEGPRSYLHVLLSCSADMAAPNGDVLRSQEHPTQTIDLPVLTIIEFRTDPYHARSEANCARFVR